MLQALLIEDDARERDALGRAVREAGFVISEAGRMDEALRRMAEEAFDLVIVSAVLPDGSGLELLKRLERRSMVVVVVTPPGDSRTFVPALALGASACLPKPVDPGALRDVLEPMLLARRKEAPPIDADGLLGGGRLGKLLGRSSSMRRVMEQVRRVAPTNATVLLLGESGVGKELVAQTIHELSLRAQKPLLAINCGAMPSSLLESELFGHEQGSFTGASKLHRGCFERSDGGTLFLDEVAEMPADAQVRLLRTLETGTVTRVGGDREVPVDVRVIAATNQRVSAAVEQGSLREDLLYRLQVFPLKIPPLRDRDGDLELLAGHFLADLNREQGTARKLSVPALEALARHAWPGNVRELRNAIQRAFILCEEEIRPEHLPPEIGRLASGAGAVRVASPSSAPRSSPGAAPEPTDGAAPEPTDGGTPAVGRPRAGRDILLIEAGTPLALVERQLIRLTLDANGGNRRLTARALGISLRTLYNRLKKYGAGARGSAEGHGGSGAARS